MLQTVTIQNFKSLKDVTVRLQKVNLLIGPNNSGKSNFLKALAFLKEHYSGRIQPSIIDLNRLYYNQDISEALNSEENPISFGFRWNYNSVKDSVAYSFYQLELFGYLDNNDLVYNEGKGISEKEIPDKYSLSHLQFAIDNFYQTYILYRNNFSYGEHVTKSRDAFDIPFIDKDIYVIAYQNNIKVTQYHYGVGRMLQDRALNTLYPRNILEVFNSIKIYKPDPSKIAKENILLFDKEVNEDCSNLVAFLDNMRDSHEDVWQAIQRDLNKCIPDFVGINFEKVKVKSTEVLGKRFGLRDKRGKTYWADELSEGTIYFLALLAIVHQPNPPEILLLEEPEKGIHPRRISEVMDLIFRLAEEKDIQIILTTHSTQVVDEFQEIPESVFVFDIQNGETKIKNLLTDIIEPDNVKAEQKAYPKLDFTKHTLGEHWAIGFLGGVPAK